MLYTKNELAKIRVINRIEQLESCSYNFNGIFLRVQKIESINDSIPLDDLEIFYKDKIKTEKRLLHYIKSRKMIKNFISEIFSIPVEEIKIYGGVRNLPYCVIRNKKFPISISHRDDYIACSFSESSVSTGVDIEKFEDVNLSNLLDFLYDFELLDKRNAIFCWSIKESFLKMIGKGLSIPSRRISVSGGLLFGDDVICDLIKKSGICKIELLVFNYSDYVLSLCLGFKSF